MISYLLWVRLFDLLTGYERCDGMHMCKHLTKLMVVIGGWVQCDSWIMENGRKRLDGYISRFM